MEGLRQITKALIIDTEIHDLLKKDKITDFMFCIGALSIIGNRQHAFNHLVLGNREWEECHVACSCGWNDESFLIAEHTDCFIPAEIEIWDKKSLDNEAVWLNGLLEITGDTMIHPILPFVYGIGICPNCHRQELYWNWQERFQRQEY